MTAQELKNSILQHAVQGKLVPQNPTDEPASVLLERIKAEKAQLINEKKIKAEKPLAPITEEEIPFEIPESWVWVRLNDIGSWGSGATPSKANSKYYTDGTIPWLKTGDLNDNIITFIPEKITELALKETSVKINPIGSVLIAMYGATIGKLGILQLEATTNQACCACQPFSQMYNWYLFYYLLSQKENFKSKSEGGAQPNISKEKILTYLFPLPPLAEQQRIVAKIEELMPLVEEYDKAEKELTELNAKFPEQIKKSVLQYAIQGKLVPQSGGDEPASELLKRIKAEKQQLIREKKIKAEKPLPPITDEEIPFEIPESWVWCRLGDVIQLINGDRGKNYPSKDKLKYEGIPFISAINLNNGFISLDNLLYMSLEQYDKLGSGKLEMNDLLFCLRGSIGKNAINQLGVGAIASSLVIWRRISINDISIKFLYQYANSYLLNSEIKKYDNGTAQPNLSASNLSTFLFPLPPLAEQQRIVEKVEEVLGVCEELKA